VSEPLVIVGNGMAAARLVDEQLSNARSLAIPSRLIGDEPRLAYNRMLLSSVLAGETAPEDIELKPMSWWRDSPSQAQGAASLELLPTFSAPHRRGDRIGCYFRYWHL
jgi:NAD(P)H-nitrite reductase large subunit